MNGMDGYKLNFYLKKLKSRLAPLGWGLQYQYNLDVGPIWFARMPSLADLQRFVSDPDPSFQFDSDPDSRSFNAQVLDQTKNSN